MGTLTTGNIKAGALESSDSPAVNTYVSFANSTVTTYDSTAYAAGGQEIETFDFTESGLSTGEAFVYEKSGAGKLQGYPGLCLVSDQVNGSQVFVDRGPSNHTITAVNDSHHDSGGSIFLHNSTSIYFDGTGDYLTVPTGSDCTFGLGDFTVECWFYPTSAGSSQVMISNMAGWTTNNAWGLAYQDNTAGISWLTDGGSWMISAGTSQASAWHHAAVCRTGALTSLYVDGALANTSATETAWTSVATLGIGATGTGAQPYTGYLDDVRIIQGKAIYTHDFIPPSRSPKDTRAYGDVADYTKITMMGYRSDSSSYFTAINYVAGDEIVARDYMGIGYDDLQAVAYTGATQKIMIFNNSTNTVKFTAYVEATT